MTFLVLYSVRRPDGWACCVLSLACSCQQAKLLASVSSWTIFKTFPKLPWTSLMKKITFQDQWNLMLNECSENAFFKHFPVLQYIFIVVLNPTFFCAIYVPEYQSHFKELVNMHGQKTFSIHPAVPLQIYLSLFSLSSLISHWST